MSIAIAKAAIDIINEDRLVENSYNMGQVLMERCKGIHDSPVINSTRGRGLMQAIEVERDSKVDGADFCNIMLENGLITKAT